MCVQAWEMRGRAPRDGQLCSVGPQSHCQGRMSHLLRKEIEVSKSPRGVYLDIRMIMIINFNYINTFNLLPTHFILTPECLNVFTAQHS